MKNTEIKNKIKIGIVGGMGPMAGVHFQKRIIEMTPAVNDQGHIEVFCHTNPTIPDRGKSLQKDGGESFVTAVEKSLAYLETAGANLGIIACNTCHAHFDRLNSKNRKMKLISLIEATVDKIVGSKNKQIILVLSTLAARKISLYEKALEQNRIEIVQLGDADAIRVDAIIYGIKSKLISMDHARQQIIEVVVPHLPSITGIILGCTELSMISLDTGALYSGVDAERRIASGRRMVEVYDPVDITIEKALMDRWV